MYRSALLIAATLHFSPVSAGGAIEVCFNYGCLARAPVIFAADDLGGIQAKLSRANTALEERAVIADAIGAMYRIAGKQTPVFADRAGNLRDGGVHGRMDCIDHSTTTTAMLNLIGSRGWLRFHEVREPARRSRFITQHFSAVVEETADAHSEQGGMSYVVDSWFVSHGEPAVILPLTEWLKGEGPSVN